MAEILKPTEDNTSLSSKPSIMLPQVSLRVPPQSQAFTVSPPTPSTTSVGGEGKDNRSSPLVQMYVPAQPMQQVMVLDRNMTPISGKNNTTNSSRWTDTETRCLLELWRANFRYLKGKKRNYQEWDLIAKEFNRRIGYCSLGPRTGNQCKIRIKNLSADYKKARDQNQPFAYYDLMHELIENKEYTVDVGEATASDLFQMPSNLTATSPPEELDTGVPPNVVTVHSVSRESTPLNSLTVSQASVSNRPITQQPIRVTQQPARVTHQPVHVTQQAEVTPQVRYLENSDEDSSADESFSEAEYMAGKRSSMSSVYEPTPRKKPRKNPKPTKIVHTRCEEVSVMAIMREFLEDSRKREEDLFRQILQHQLQAERRYQDFTLEVVKEIGQLFKRD